MEEEIPTLFQARFDGCHFIRDGYLYIWFRIPPNEVGAYRYSIGDDGRVVLGTEYGRGSFSVYGSDDQIRDQIVEEIGPR